MRTNILPLGFLCIEESNAILSQFLVRIFFTFHMTGFFNQNETLPSKTLCHEKARRNSVLKHFNVFPFLVFANGATA